MPSLERMMFSWGDSRTAFADATGWFVRTAALVGDRWDRPGLGEWDVACHPDLSQQNFMFRDMIPVAIIDWGPDLPGNQAGQLRRVPLGVCAGSGN